MIPRCLARQTSSHWHCGQHRINENKDTPSPHSRVWSRIFILDSRVADSLPRVPSLSPQCRECKQILGTVSVQYCSLGREITSETESAARATDLPDKSPALASFLTDLFASRASATPQAAAALRSAAPWPQTAAASEESPAAEAVPALMNEARPSPDSFREPLGSPGRKAEPKRAKNRVTGVFLSEQTAQVPTCQTFERPAL